MKRKCGFSALTVVFIALLMTGCGGGGGGGGSDSPPVLSPPATVSATPGIGEVTINWTDVTGATSYNVYRSETSPVTKTTGEITTVNDNTVAISGLDIVKWYFVVTAVNANGESVESVEVSATPVLPSPPTGVTASPGDNTATIRWTSVAGATSYNVYHSETSPVTKATGEISTGTDNSLVVPGLANGTPYYFVVTVVVNGLESLESDEETATPTPALPPAPPAPSSVSAGPGAGSATITWPAVVGATSYNIYYSTSTGVTIATGTKVTGATSGISIPNLIRGIPYFFVVTAENAGGESGVSNEDTATPNPPAPVFSQADLAGTWNVRVLRSGSSQGWYLQTITVDATGSVTVQGNGGPLSPPSLGTLSMLAGVVTDGANPKFHGKMSSSKNLIVGTSTYLDTSFALHIFVKQVSGVTYSSADLANKTFRYHRIYTGSSYFWEKADGSIDASRQLSLSSLVDSSGTLTPPVPPYPTISVDGTGIVTISNELSTFYGVMSSDKKIIVGTSTDPAGKYSLRIIQMLGQNFTQADLAGTTVAHAFGPSATSGWAYATRVTDPSGVVTFSEFVDQDGGTSFPDSFTWNIDPQGSVTSSGGTPSSGGGMTFGKDLIVRIGTGSVASYMELTAQ